MPIRNDSPTSCKLQRNRDRAKSDGAGTSVHYDKDDELVKLLPKDPHQDAASHSGISENSNLSNGLKLEKKEFSFRTVPRIVWMLYISGVLHNITDGLAVGASFAGDFPGGISTTLAILFHEIPHAIGLLSFLRPGLTKQHCHATSKNRQCIGDTKASYTRRYINRRYKDPATQGNIVARYLKVDNIFIPLMYSILATVSINVAPNLLHLCLCSNISFQD